MSKTQTTALALVLSTAHITSATRTALTLGSVETLCYPKGVWGWFVSVPSDLGESASALPLDLWYCLKYARNAGADWIIFDSEGPAHRLLQTYPATAPALASDPTPQPAQDSAS